MNKYSYNIFFASLLVLLVGCAHDLYQKGNVQYYNTWYSSAVPYYEKALAKKEIPDAVIKLAECYRYLNNMEKAEMWYRKAVLLPQSKPYHKLQFAQILKENHKCEEALTVYQSYLFENKDKVRYLKFKNFCDPDSMYRSSPQRFVIEPLSMIGSGESDYGAVFYKDGIVFLSNRKSNENLFSFRKPQEHTFYDLYYAKYNGAKGFQTPEPLKGEVNTPFHEGPATFSSDFNTIYFTRSDFYKNLLGETDENVNVLKIYKAVLQGNGEWAKLEVFPYNNNQYSVGHPSLTKDGKKLYFVSDMPGGYGGTDIYVSERDSNGWGKPLNLGPTINSAGNELFPFIYSVDKDSTPILYYSSDGLPGLGGLDIYSAKLVGKTFQEPELLPFPINSSNDDFGMIVDEKQRYGYFSTNRYSTNGIDMLYHFEINPKMYTADEVMALEGTIADKETKKPISKVSVVLTEKKTMAKDSLLTKDDGKYKFQVKSNSEYSLVAKKDSFFTTIKEISIPSKIIPVQIKNHIETEKATEEIAPQVIVANMEPEKLIKTPKIEVIKANVEAEKIVINKPIALPNIYYEFNKWEINEASSADLVTLVKIMKDNPKIIVQVNSHTDSRGSAAYNQILSSMRARAVVKYLIKQGIVQRRIRYKGYGESKPLNKCVDGVECTDDEYKTNRRTEFEVTKIGE